VEFTALASRNLYEGIEDAYQNDFFFNGSGVRLANDTDLSDVYQAISEANILQ
jgi:hypothetical protein